MSKLQQGVALIVEGTTEKVFYQVYLEYCCLHYSGFQIERQFINGDLSFIVKGPDCEGCLVVFHSMDTITQMPNAGAWFKNVCKASFATLPWRVFLCYDSDEYHYPVTKFHEGDWERLREEIGLDAEGIYDLTAEADIEDVMLCDYEGVLSWLGLPADTVRPSGRNGKSCMRNLFRLSGERGAYHTGERSRPLVEALDMNAIERAALVDLRTLRQVIFEPVNFDR
ncbi:hypothetical protein [Eggerthella sp. YY7918]|uniref:hypothetical protein n=1 Tax=Eggerthella sp. (strain YY7918) TaxID=502558 RepID=UPI0002171612|nr:hypothetical protein [Eggerthella sp. YY7918]BAK44978.1 hypothetical protein EGYY_18450 [Eggerthella sp. YY7918]